MSSAKKDIHNKPLLRFITVLRYIACLRIWNRIITNRAIKKEAQEKFMEEAYYGTKSKVSHMEQLLSGTGVYRVFYKEIEDRVVGSQSVISATSSNSSQLPKRLRLREEFYIKPANRRFFARTDLRCSDFETAKQRSNILFRGRAGIRAVKIVIEFARKANTHYKKMEYENR